MATTSEIQVTEAYIGLLGRAPDPAGLAYWAAQLDSAIAAGEDAAVALKKLTNDITLSAEWDGGLGANVASDGSVTQAGAEAIVSGMYLNLFEKTATAADLTYWTAELVAGTTTASEMAVQLIQGAGTTDAGTLGYKQEAATYYVENVDQADFNRSTANEAVDAVSSPLTLQASKDSTDIIVSGVGVTKALTTGTDTISMTGGDDTVTGLVGTGATLAAADTISDSSTTDNDTLTITGDGDGVFGTVKNVENINVSLAARDLAGGFDLTATTVTGGDVTLTVADEVTIAGVKFAGEQTATVTNLASSDLTTNNVKDLTVTGASGTQAFTLDNDAATVSISGVTANDTTVSLANNDVTMTISGTAATNDAMTISGDNEVAISNGASDVELLTLSGTNNDVVFTFTNVSDDSTKMVYTTAGSNDITLAGSVTQFNGSTLVDNNSGTETLKLTGVNAGSSIEGLGALSGGITLASAGTHDLKLASGNTLTNTTAGAAISVDANDAATDSAVTINLSATANGITTNKFETVTIDANDSQVTTTGALDFTDNSGAVVTISGTNDITTTTVTGAHSLTISGDDVTVGAITATNEVTITGANDVVGVAMTVDNDITLTAGTTAGQDVSLTGNIAINTGNFKASGDDVSQTGTTAVTKGDITITATNDVSVTNTVTASAGDISVTSVAKDITLGGQVTATKGSVTITAANDANINNITAQNDIDINVGTGAGKDLADVDVLSSTGTGNITVDADDITDISGSITAANGSVTITSANDITDAASDITASKGTVTLTATAGDLTTDNGAAGKTLTGANVVLTAADDIVGKAAITAQNDVTITTTDGGATNDITQSGLITTTKAGTITLTAADVTVGQITAAESNVVITASQVAKNTAAIAVTKGSVTITGNDATGTDVDLDAAISASNDVTITGAGKVDAEATITSSKNNVSITGDQVDVKAITATVGSVTLTAIDPAMANGSKIEGDITAGTNVTIADGNWDIDDDITATGIFAVSGDAMLDLAADEKIKAGSVQLTTANDVTINGTTDSVLIIGSGGGDYDLSTVEYSTSSDDVTINTGGGNDTMDITDGADASTSKFIVTTGGGIDTVTATSYAAGTVVNTGAGNDEITIKLATALNTGTTSTFDGGADTDELKLDTGDYSGKKVAWSNIEELTVGNGTQNAVLSEAQFDGDNTFKVLNSAGTISVTGSTLDASGVTYAAGSGAKFDFTGASSDDVLTGSSNADIIDGAAGQDTLTGGTGADTFQVTAGQSGGGTTDAIKFDTITDFNIGGSSDIIDHNQNLTKGVGNIDGGTAAGTAVVDANGLATFDAADDTLAEKLTAVAQAIDETTAGVDDNSTAVGETVIFVHSGDTYVYISDANSGYGTGDDVIKLTGHTSLTTITIAGDNATIG
jgi:hypothetical protein